jgi:polar amino acid transport system ATP-binding protein
MKLEIKKLSKSLGRQKILNNIDLTLPDCKEIALIGPSGSGKSTILRLLAGLERPDAGELLFNGKPIPYDEDELINYRKSVGIVFQSFNLFPHLTALENISLPLHLAYGFEKQDAEQKGLELLNRFDLVAHAHKKPAQLSGGQCQRVAIVRAIAVPRQLLLFDEPTSALDPLMTSEVLDLIADLKDSSIVIASHHIGFVLKFADWILFVDGGKIVESASNEEFFSSPKSPNAKQFLEKILKY